MAQRSKPQWARFGRELRRIRTQAGLTQDQLGRQVALSYASISAIERGRQGIRTEQVAQIDHLLSTGGSLVRLWETLAKGDGLPVWYQDAATFEKQATEIRTYQLALIPGLVQTESYARTVLRAQRSADTDAEIESLVTGRMHRQEIMGHDRSPLLLAVLDEMAIRRPVGGPEVMTVQLEKLLKAADHSRVSIQIIPFSTHHPPGLAGAFVMYRDQKGTEIAYQDGVLYAAPAEHPDQITECARLFEELRAVALAPVQSRKLIEKVLQGGFPHEP